MKYKITYKALDATKYYNNLTEAMVNFYKANYSGVEVMEGPYTIIDYITMWEGDEVRMSVSLHAGVVSKYVEASGNYLPFDNMELKFFDELGIILSEDFVTITGQTIEDWWDDRNEI